MAARGLRSRRPRQARPGGRWHLPTRSERALDRRGKARFGGDLPVLRWLTWQGRLIDSKSRKRLKKRGVRRSLQCSSKWPVGSIRRESTRIGHRRWKPEGPFRQGWEVALGLDLESGSSPPGSANRDCVLQRAAASAALQEGARGGVFPRAVLSRSYGIALAVESVVPTLKVGA